MYDPTWSLGSTLNTMALLGRLSSSVPSTVSPHVRIVRVGDPNELKLISVSALLERYDFALE